MRKKKASAGQGRTPQNKQRPDYTNTQLAEQLLSRFRGRRDVIAVSTQNGFIPEWLAKPLSAAWLAEEHLGGKRCNAMYLLREDDKVEVTCLDFDDKPHAPDAEIKTKVEAVVDCLRKHGLRPLVERSQSGRGVHVWLFMQSPRPARLVRTLWRGVLRHLGLPENTEIFPRQDVRGGKGLGNPIRFPLWNKSDFVDVTKNWRRIDPVRALSNVTPVSRKRLERAASRMGIELLGPKKIATVTNSNLLPGTLSPRVVQLLADVNGDLARRWRGNIDGLKDTSRSSIVSSIAVLLIYRHVPTAEIEAAIKNWCCDCGYEKGIRQDWIDLVIARAYEFVWRSSDTRRYESKRRSSITLPKSLSGEYHRQVMKRVRTKKKGDGNGKK